MISDINEFCKLFKIHVPVPSEQEYYFAQLQKSQQYDWLSNSILEFETWEKELLKVGFSIGKEKTKYLNLIIQKLKETSAYEKINNTILASQNEIAKFDFLSSERNLRQHLVSIDLKSANYTLFLHFDPENKLRSGWQDYISDLPVPLQKSKSFRQVVFGNLNPKRTQKLIFSELTCKMKEKIDSRFQNQDKCCALLTDEIVYTFPSRKEAFQFCLDFPREMEMELDLRLRLTYLQPQGISGKDFSWANIIEDIFTDQEKKYKKLIGVPGNQFYLYFKKFILEEKIEDRDLFFMQDNQLAKWVV